MKSRRYFLFVLFVAAAILLAACSQPADATMNCNTTDCQLKVINNQNTDLHVSVAVDWAEPGGPVEFHGDNTYINPGTLVWKSVISMDQSVADYVIKPSKALEFGWTTHQTGLYRATVHADATGLFYEDGATVTYAWFNAEPSTPPVVNSRTIQCLDPIVVTLYTMDVNAGAYGTAIYVNDRKWVNFVDPNNTVSELALPVPTFLEPPTRINVSTNKWDTFIEVDRDGHKDHQDAAYCAYPYDAGK